MQNIEVHRYAPKATGWQGYVQPADRSWIMFVKDDGSVWVSMDRDPATGACK